MGLCDESQRSFEEFNEQKVENKSTSSVELLGASTDKERQMIYEVLLRF